MSTHRVTDIFQQLAGKKPAPPSPEEGKARACWSEAKLLFFISMTRPKEIDEQNRLFEMHIKYYKPKELERAWEVTKEIFESARAVIQASKDGTCAVEIPNLGTASIDAAVGLIPFGRRPCMLGECIYEDIWDVAATVANSYLPPHEFPDARNNLLADMEANRHRFERTRKMCALTDVSGQRYPSLSSYCVEMFHEAVDEKKSCSIRDDNLHGDTVVIALQACALSHLQLVAEEAWATFGKAKELGEMTPFLPESAKRDLKVSLYDYHEAPLDVSSKWRSIAGIK